MSAWWREPVIAWAIVVDAEPDAKGRRYGCAVPIFAEDGADLGNQDGIETTVTIIPAAPGTARIRAVIGGGSGVYTLGFEHGTRPDEQWDVELRNFEADHEGRPKVGTDARSASQRRSGSAVNL